MKSSARKIQLTSYDDLFKNDEEGWQIRRSVFKCCHPKKCSRFRITPLR